MFALPNATPDQEFFVYKKPTKQEVRGVDVLRLPMETSRVSSVAAKDMPSMEQVGAQSRSASSIGFHETPKSDYFDMKRHSLAVTSDINRRSLTPVQNKSANNMLLANPEIALVPATPILLSSANSVSFSNRNTQQVQFSPEVQKNVSTIVGNRNDGGINPTLNHGGNENSDLIDRYKQESKLQK